MDSPWWLGLLGMGRPRPRPKNSGVRVCVHVCACVGVTQGAIRGQRSITTRGLELS